MNEIARNYDDDLTKRSFNNQQQSHLTTQLKNKAKENKKNKKKKSQ